MPTCEIVIHQVWYDLPGLDTIHSYKITENGIEFAEAKKKTHDFSFWNSFILIEKQKYFLFYELPIFCNTDSKYDPMCSSRLAHDTMISFVAPSSLLCVTSIETDCANDNR